MKFPIEEKFSFSEVFLNEYKDRNPSFGFNGLGEFVFYRTYSRIKENGRNESWQDVIKRVVEGEFSLQRQHVEDNRLGWDNRKAQLSAKETFDRIFNFKMIPSGRSLWSMGTPLVMEKGLTSSLFSCAFVSTKDMKEDAGRPFEQVMDLLMTGVGVGGDTLGAGLEIKELNDKEPFTYVIPDTREGWVESVGLAINAFFGGDNPDFDYSLIRPFGSPIKTFGGTASGHEPLEELHNAIFEMFSNSENNVVTERNIVDIFNLIAKAVVAGNTRRSAEIMIGDGSEEFLNLKNYEINPERASFGWASNNTVIANVGDDYSEIAKRIADNGEPGIFWLTNAREYGRMRKDERNFKDKEVAGLNPCFASGTKILTKYGYKNIENLVGENPVYLISKNGEVVQSEVFETGEKETIEILLTNHQRIICTPDHEFMINDGGRVMAKNIVGKQLMPFVSKPKLSKTFVVFGFAQGDGNLTRLSSETHKGIEFNIGKKDGEIISLLDELNIKYKWHSDRTIYVSDIKNSMIALGFDAKTLPERELPNTYFGWHTISKSSFLNGLFCANGSVNNGRITLKTTSKKLAEQLLVTLETDFDIHGFITTNYPKEVLFSNGTYTTKESYDVNISKYSEKQKFANKIGFYFEKKYNALSELLISSAPSVRRIKDMGVQSVYDFSMVKTHWGVVEGFVAHNCGEITLEDAELCNLVEIVLPNHETLEDFKRTIKYAYLYGKTMTLIGVGWENTNRVLMRNRRIGLSLTGIAQFTSIHGLNTLIEWMQAGYETARYYDDVYSKWLGVRESIKVTTVKPSGTVSLLAGCTAGLHYPESSYYIRRVRIGKGSQFEKILRKAGYKIEPAFGQEDSTLVVEFPVFIGEGVRTIEDVSMWEQLSMAGFAQEYWADNSVSVTVTFSKEEENQIKTALEVFQYKLKAVSMLPKLDASYPQMPYEKIEEKEYYKIKSSLKDVDFSELTGNEAENEKYCSNDFCEI